MDNDTLTTETTTVSREMPRWAYAVVADKVAKLNKRAEKKALTGSVTLTCADERRVKISDETELFDRFETWVTATITTIPVVLDGGWSLAGVVDFATAAPAVLLNSIQGGPSLPEEFREVSVCDHCSRKVRRNKLIVVQGTDGQFVRVGTTCVRDYLGVNPSDLLWFVETVAELTDEDADWERGSGNSDWGYETATVVCAALFCVRRWGWKPASFDAPTREDVTRMLDRERANEHREVTEARTDFQDTGCATHLPEAERIVEWVRALDPTGNDYLQNLCAVLGNELVRPKGMGLAVSVVSAWDKHLGKQAEQELRKAADADIPNEWIGAKGDKVELTGRVTAYRTFEGDYGTQAIIVVGTPQGRVKVFTSADSSFSCEADEARKNGTDLTFKGTIKGHETYEGTKQTVMTRCKAIIPPEVAAARKAVDTTSTGPA